MVTGSRRVLIEGDCKTWACMGVYVCRGRGSQKGRAKKERRERKSQADFQILPLKL